MALQERKIRFIETLIEGTIPPFPGNRKPSASVNSAINKLDTPEHKQQYQTKEQVSYENKNSYKRKADKWSFVGLKKIKTRGACDRCRHRKKKCDGENGAPCSGCLGSKNECTYGNSAPKVAKQKSDNTYDPKHILVNAGSNIHTDGLHFQQDLMATHSVDFQSADSPVHRESELPKNDSSQFSTSETTNFDCKDVVDGKLYNSITILLNDRREDSYIGSTAIIHKVNLIRSSIASRIYKRRDSQQNLHDPDGLPKTQDPAYTEIPANTEEKLENLYVTYYTDLISQRYYCYDDTDLVTLFPRCFQRKLKADTISSISTKDSYYKSSVSSLILALGCRLFKLSKGVDNISPKVYFERAIEQISLIETPLAIVDQIRLLMLISVFLFYSYDNSINFAIKVWGLTGLAVRKVTQIGLHRFEMPSVSNSREYESRKRLFWSIYTFERILCLILGRATSISDQEIDVPYALNINSLEDYSNAELYDLQIRQQVKQYEMGDHRIVFPGNVGSSYYLIQLSRLREIETNISRLERRMTVPIPQSLTKEMTRHKHYSSMFEKVAQQLEEWKDQLPKACDFNKGMKNQVNFEYLTLAYCRAKTLLCLTKIIMKEYDGKEEFEALLHEICDAAGGICKSYLIIAKGPSFSYGMFSLHTIFLVGILLAYSIVNLESHVSNNSNRSNLWRYHNYLRHCSVLLSIFAERTRKAASFRILFEELLENGVYSSSQDDQSPDTYPNVSVETSTSSISYPLNEVHTATSDKFETDGPSSLPKEKEEFVVKKEATVLEDLMEIFFESEFQSEPYYIHSDDDEIWNEGQTYKNFI